MGRAFWILDDLGPLQQSMGTISEEDFQVFASKATPRVSSSSRGGANIGKNPPSGVIIYYSLPEDMDSTNLTLEIIDHEGKVVRSYSNKKDKSFKKYTGGPSPEKVISSKKGVNRLNWDMRRSNIPGINKVFVLGSYSGSTIGPGQYTVKLSTKDKSIENKIEVQPDPRLELPIEAYSDQQYVLEGLHRSVVEIHESVNRMQKIKNQIEVLKKVLKEVPEAKDFLKQAETLDEKINEWLNQLIQKDQKTFQDVINFPNRLNAEIMNLIDRVDTGDPRVTEGAKTRMKDLSQEWSTFKSQMMQILEMDVKQFNEAYKKLEIPALILPDKA